MKTKLTLLLAIAGLGLTPSQAELTIPDSKPNAPEQQAAPQAEQKAVAYLGVLTRDVPEELRTQFSLAEGFGLLVEDVMPGSPAATAGLKHHDVLLKLADQQLVNAEQLLTLVRSHKKGDSVSLTIITGGKETQITATLGEHMTSTHRPGPSSLPWNQPEMKHFFGERFQNSDMGERLRDLQKEVQKHQERMQQWNRGHKKDHLPTPPPAHPHEEGKKEGATPQNAPIHSEIHVQTQISSAAANIIRRDDTGEYQLKTEDGKKTFIVRPKDGTEKSWPVNTDKEREAVPEAYREKLNLFDSVKIDISTPAVGPQPTKPTPPTPPTPQTNPSRDGEEIKRGTSV